MSSSTPPKLTHVKGSRRRRPTKNLRTWLLAGSIIAVISVSTLFFLYYNTRAGLIDIDLIKDMPKASIVYDYQGKPFSRFFDENRIQLPSNEPVPKLLGEAVVATEDHRFYSHGSIDPYGIGRAAVSNFLGHGSRQGASTITQQLARNSIGRLERTYDRKFLEIFFAHRIESAYTKEQILRYYLDRIYFGQGLYGAETTANAFFGIPASKLNLAQCALLAGMISSPNASSPWKDIKNAKTARNKALGQMVKAGYITQAEADKAQKAPLALRPRPDFGGGFATSEARRQIEQEIDPDTVQQGGLKIYTTIDPRLQGVAENALATRIHEIEVSKGETHLNPNGDPNTGLPGDDLLQGAFIAVDPTNGGVRAVVGSRDFGISQYNRAMQSRRQVGSTIKPLIYATAFAEKHYSPASLIDASQFDMTRAKYGVMPAGEGGTHYLRINDALVPSDDYSSVRMAIILGPQLLNDYAHRCGVTTDLPPYPSVGLGTCEMSLSELTAIYATFANQGVWVKQHVVDKVLDDHDRVIYEFHPEKRRVFSAQVARQVTGMLENVLDFGTGRPVRQNYRFTSPAAGKTGTTNDYKDAWFEGFTSRLVCGTWIGYDQPKEIMPGGYAATVALPVWANVMKQAQGYPMQPFPLPSGMEVATVGGSLFTQGQRYYFLPGQRAQLDQEAADYSPNDEPRAPEGRNFIDHFLDIFR